MAAGGGRRAACSWRPHSSVIGIFVLVAAALTLGAWLSGSRRGVDVRRQATLNKLRAFDLRELPVPPDGNTNLAYIAPNGSSAVSFSICAKCGSTTLFYALFAAVYGRPFPERHGPPWIQKWTSWPKKGRPEGAMLLYAGHLRNHPEITWMHFHVYRDPIDRYISSYFSKLRCCGEEVPGAAPLVPNRTGCAKDRMDQKSTVASLYQAANMLTTPCLYFEEYAHLLEKARVLQTARGLNIHVRPQFLPQKEPHQIVSAGTIADMAFSLNSLAGLGLNRIKLEHLHAANRNGFEPSTAAMKVMCSAAAGEYKQLKLPSSPLCPS